MNPQTAAVTRFALSIFVGVLFYSSWSLGRARFAVPAGAIPKLQYRAPAAFRTLPPADTRLKIARRLGDVFAAPAKIVPGDAAAMKKMWGKDSVRMLEILKQSR